MKTPRPVSIRIRLTAWYSAVLASGLLLFALAVWILLRRTLYEDLQQELLVRTKSLEAFVTNERSEPGVHLTEELEEYCDALPKGTYFWLFDQSGKKLFYSDETRRQPSNVELLQVYSPWRFWKQPQYLLEETILALPGERYRIVGSISAQEVIRLLRQLEVLLITLTPAVLLVASFGGYLLSRRALQPVDEITEVARTLSIRDLSGRLAVSRTGDELQRLSATWNSMLDRLQHAVQRLTRFTQDASHELRTPLAIIRSTAEIASRRSRSEEAYRTAFRQIVEESDRLTALVEDLLLLARGDQPFRTEMTDVHLSVLAADVCREMKALATQKGVLLTTEISVGTSIRGHKLLLRRLLTVLLDNAIQYSPSGSAISVCLTLAGDACLLHVIDRGLGIAKEDLPHIFERFYRGEAAREAWSGGTGLGLSLAHSIAEQHGATISVSSELGSGSAFIVTFPISAALRLSVG